MVSYQDSIFRLSILSDCKWATDICVSETGTSRPLRGQEGAKLIVLSHAADFVISAIKSTDIMQFNWTYKGDCVLWWHFHKLSQWETKEKIRNYKN